LVTTPRWINWITGKAGSGKSTLMKTLINHPDVAKASKVWAGKERLVNASFFFWNAGTAIQKSQEGLFKSLLYEILRQCPDMIRTVCASKAKTFRPFIKDFESWTRQELWHAIGQLKHYSGISAQFCFFIDGLDEYDGDLDRLVDVLENLRSWQNIKLCVSSRPWNEFIDAFGRPSDAQLAMEDLTRKDIRVYARETLEDNLLFRRLDARDPRSQDLVREIVEKARGVFLWVTLVVKSLLTGVKNADRISDLEIRLRDFSATLEQYFSLILHSVEVIYRKQTAQAFTFALEEAEPLSLLTYSFLDEEDLDALLTSTRDLLTMNDILTRRDDMQKRLNGRCEGLLKVVRGEVTSEHRLLKVDYLHRTVYDFPLTEDVRNMLDENLGPEFEPKIRLCKAFLAQLKLRGPHQLEIRSSQLLEDLTFYAVALETDSGIHQVEIMNAIRDVVLERESAFGVAGGRAGFLDFLVHRGSHLHITETLKSKPEVSPSTKTALLGSALEPRETKYCNNLYDTKMVQLLLEHGAAPNGRHKNSTVWGTFLLSIRQKSRGGVTDDLKQIIESLLRYGANPYLRIITGQKTVAGRAAGRKMSGRAADLHKKLSSTGNIIDSAQEILTQLLGPAEARELLSKARNSQSLLKSSVSRLMSWKFAVV